MLGCGSAALCFETSTPSELLPFRMRTALVAVLLALVSLPAPASELYILPAYAKQVSNGVLSWRSEVLVTNPHRHLVELEIVSMLGATEPHGCRFPEFSLPFPATLAAGETRLLCMPFVTSGAVAFRASDTLAVTSEMTATRYENGTWVTTRQPIEPGRRWIEPGERGAIFHVRSSPPDSRANLVVVNPGDVAITVHYTMVRTGS